MLTAVTSPAVEASAVEGRYRDTFRRLHAGHSACASDEWLDAPCIPAGGGPTAPVVWSRRNGPWRRVDVLWIGAAPGNDGGLGEGALGSHGTRIPFGGDIAGANLDLLLSAIGLTRDDTFIAAALNRLPERGGGEPRVAELARPAGDFPDSVEALRATILASGAALVVALGNVALRSALAAACDRTGAPLRLPGLGRIEADGFRRGVARRWPEAGESAPAAGEDFRAAWERAWGPRPLPHLLWLLHPSAQNMSPYAGPGTSFHRRMVDTRTALVRVASELGIGGGGGTGRSRSVYETAEWRERVGPRHDPLVALWRRKGL
ncbi:MAG TPA: uracil-DNA glycosylase family protein [Longimicrobiales bacterium]|nr:uracil-DNA glycosylase family protein [Longimicrobiales bacterium]